MRRPVPTGGLGPLARLFGLRRGRLPDFLCIGAQEAGATTLHELLRAHPGVFLPPLKEVHYFSLHFDRPLPWYESVFASARPGQVAGEITSYYLFHPAAPARIAATVPGVRLIVLLRDPVDRAISGYFHSRRHGMEPLGIEEAFEAEEERTRDAERDLAEPGRRNSSHQWHGYVARSRYELQLPRYLERFPRSQVLLIRSEDLFAEPVVACRSLLDFLGLPPLDRPSPMPRADAGNGEAAYVDDGLRARLRAALEPTYAAMARDHGISWTDARGGADAHRGP